MKHVWFIVFGILSVFSSALHAQMAGDYRTKSSGLWSSPATWEYYDGSTWSEAQSFPTAVNGQITIDSSVTLDTTITVDQLRISPSGSLSVGIGKTLTIANGNDSVDAVVRGTIFNYGTITPTGRLSFEDGAMYYHRYPGGTGSIPISTWRDGSTCQIDSASSGGGNPSNITNQSFYNFVWNASQQSGNVGLNFPDGYVFRGNLIISSTGKSTNAWRLTNLSAGQTKTITILGDVVVNGSNAMLTATGSSSDTAAKVNVYVGGNVLVSAGVLNLVAASNPYAEWFINGDVKITGGQLNRGGLGAWRGTLTFAKNGVQEFLVQSPGAIVAGVTYRIADSATNVRLRFPWQVNGILRLDHGRILTDDTNYPTILPGSRLEFIHGWVDGPLAYSVNQASEVLLQYPLGREALVRPFALRLTQSSTSTTVYIAELKTSAPPQRTLPPTLDAMNQRWYITVTKTGGGDITSLVVTMSYTCDDGYTNKDSLRIARDDGAGGWENCGGSGTGDCNGTINSNVLLSMQASTDFVLAHAAPNIVANLPVVTTLPIDTNYISTTTAPGGGTVLNDGGAAVVERGVCWNTTGSPTIDDRRTLDGSGTGMFTSLLTELNPGTQYYVRAYAKNSAGVAYGEEVIFSTLQELIPPVVITKEVTNIVGTSALSGGNVVKWGGTPVTERGVCWSLSPNPTINDEKTISGSGLGSFTSAIGGLELGKVYYVRAYAMNSTGVGYGNEVTFRTPDPQPDVTKIVAKDGTGDYRTVQDAFRDVPLNYTGKWYIYIKKGIYEERDTLASGKNNVILVGEDRDSTIIRYDIYAADGKRNPVVQLNGNDISVLNLTIQNTSHDIAQGLALETNGDRIAFYNCKILGYQDTYLGNGVGRVYFHKCFIEGTVDFIYGGSIMIFDSCTINIIRNGGYITAGSTLPSSKYGINFLDCQITHPEIGYNGVAITSFYLGRPWQNSPRVVYIRCYEPAAVAPAGWTAMGTTPALFGEYQCYGEGFRPTQRTTQWGNAVRVLSDSEATYYTIESIFSKYSMTTPFASNWIPQKPFVEFPLTSTESSLERVPQEFRLHQNYPNPFNPSTTIEYEVAKTEKVTLKIYTVHGKEVATLVDRIQTPGHYRVSFDATSVSSGVYYYSFSCGKYRTVKKMIVLK